MGAHSSLVGEAPRYKPEGRGFETRLGEWSLLDYLNLPAALGLGVYSAPNRNECQKQKLNAMFLGSRTRPAHKTDNLTASWELIS
jgi:hypothetical protein